MTVALKPRYLILGLVGWCALGLDVWRVTCVSDYGLLLEFLRLTVKKEHVVLMFVSINKYSHLKDTNLFRVYCERCHRIDDDEDVGCVSVDQVGSVPLSEGVEYTRLVDIE